MKRILGRLIARIGQLFGYGGGRDFDNRAMPILFAIIIALMLVSLLTGCLGGGGGGGSSAKVMRSASAAGVPTIARSQNTPGSHAIAPSPQPPMAGAFPQIPVEQVWVQRHMGTVGVYSTAHCAELIDTLPLADIFNGAQPYHRDDLDWPAVYELTIEAMPGDVVSVDFEGMATSERDAQTSVITYAAIRHPNGAVKPIMRKMGTNLDRRHEHHLLMQRRATFVVPPNWTDGLLTIEWNWGAFAYGDFTAPYVLDIGVDEVPIDDNRCYGGMTAEVKR